MSASLRTKDGSVSIAGVILADEKVASRQAPIDMDGATAWGRENGVDLRRVKRPLDRINSQRAELGLPQFKIIKSEYKASRRVQPIPAPARLVPMVSSEDDLLKRIIDHNGTLTGLVTPQIAEWLLRLNTGNRPLDRGGIERFCKILRDGAWLNTGEPVILSREAVLNDGQHRLAAIVQSGIAAELDVRFGIIREAFHATGTGRTRTAAHVLGIEGYSHTSCQAAIARLLIHYDKGQIGNRGQIELGEILRVVNKDDNVCEVAAKIQRSKFRPTRTGPFGFVLVVAARTAPLERVFEFAGLVASGMFQSEDESEPTRRLHVKMRDAAMARDRISQIDVAILTVKAWNAWVEGEKVPQLRVFEADRTSAGFPRVQNWPDKRGRLAA